MTDKPLPCPFCGHPPDKEVVNKKYMSKQYVLIGCCEEDCFVKPNVEMNYNGDDTIESKFSEVVQKWNVRS